MLYFLGGIGAQSLRNLQKGKSGTLVLQQRWSQTGHRWTPLPGIVAQTEVPGCQEASLHRQRLRHDLSKYGRWPSMHFEDENSLIACAQNEVEHL
ncbi:hypothetical protein Y1Q_0019823 [Alligator mississippiensis]|uniref:Uncharacterized protein n=1 Tax=Alligator mississippiensis TaxID=8496 RepID=A0A151PFH0_ALLMI|nr:hypothetical protein Y1Q_0019823 [Alligator mississippiensis]